MKKIIIQKLNSNIVEFQAKIKSNLQLYWFSRDAIVHFSRYYKAEFKNYEFLNFANKFKNISIKNTLENIKYGRIRDYGDDLIENKLTDLVFILNMSDFEAWSFEFLNQIFSSDYETFLRYLNAEKTPFNLSLLEQSKTIEEIWQKIIDRHLFNKGYEKKDEILRDLLSACNIKIDESLEVIIGKINENFLCRNIIIHNMNKVNAEYLIKSKAYAKFKENERIKISEEYLFEQGDNLLFFMQKVKKALN